MRLITPCNLRRKPGGIHYTKFQCLHESLASKIAAAMGGRVDVDASRADTGNHGVVLTRLAFLERGKQ